MLPALIYLKHGHHEALPILALGAERVLFYAQSTQRLHSPQAETDKGKCLVGLVEPSLTWSEIPPPPKKKNIEGKEQNRVVRINNECEFRLINKLLSLDMHCMLCCPWKGSTSQIRLWFSNLFLCQHSKLCLPNTESVKKVFPRF